MSRLHKIAKFSLIKKYYIAFFFLILYGCYKNGILPHIEGYQSIAQMIHVFLFPLTGFLLGFFLDFICKNKDIYNCKFFGVLFSLFLPFQTKLWFYLIFLSILLFIYLIFSLKKIDCNLNFIVIGKLLFVLFLLLFHTYNYQNPLESKGLFQYSFLDFLLGHNTSGLFTSSIILLILSIILFASDEYYKKEIPFYSYGIYMLTLVSYAILKKDMSFLIMHTFSSSILFAFIFIATLSFASPYTKKSKFMYSILIGGTTLYFSLLTNFQEGVYLSILLANLFFVFTSTIIEKQKVKRIRKKQKI